MGRPPIGIPILRWLGAQRYRKKQRTDLNRRKRSKQRLRQRKDTGLRQEERFSVASVISCSSLFLISSGVNPTLMQGQNSDLWVALQSLFLFSDRPEHKAT